MADLRLAGRSLFEASPATLPFSAGSTLGPKLQKFGDLLNLARLGT